MITYIHIFSIVVVVSCAMTIIMHVCVCVCVAGFGLQQRPGPGLSTGAVSLPQRFPTTSAVSFSSQTKVVRVGSLCVCAPVWGKGVEAYVHVLYTCRRTETLSVLILFKHFVDFVFTLLHS